MQTQVQEPDFAGLHHFSKHAIARAFAQKAGTYRRYATIQRTILDELIELLARRSLFESASSWLDIGSGPFLFEEAASTYLRGAKITCLDLAFGMLSAPRPSSGRILPVVGDADALPFRAPVFDRIVCTSMIQWVSSIPILLRNCHQLLDEGGIMVLSCFLADHLKEFRWVQKAVGIESGGWTVDQGYCDALLDHAGFRVIDTTVLRLTLFYSSPYGLIRELVGIGATPRGLARSPQRLFRLCDIYRTRFGTQAGVPSTLHAGIVIAQRSGKR